MALALALLAAVSHAVFGALQKGRHDPWLSRGAIDVAYAAMAAPVALLLVPWPLGREWAILAGAAAIHVGYKLAQAKAYSRAPSPWSIRWARHRAARHRAGGRRGVRRALRRRAVARGADALGRHPGAVRGATSAAAGSGGRGSWRRSAGRWLTGVFVAAYTTYDAWGIRATPDPFTFLAWFFLLDGLVFPWIAAARWRRMAGPPGLGPLLARGVTGGLVAYVSFGSIMLATRIDKVGQAAVLRETSVVFAALIGWAFLGERVGALRAALVVLIAAGAVVMEFGGG